MSNIQASDDNRKNRIAGTTLSMINMAVSIIVGLVYTPFLLQSLGKSENGVYTLANSIISFLSILDLGLGSALVRYTTRARAEGKKDEDINGAFLKLYSTIAVVALLVGLIIFVNLGRFFGTSFTAEELKILKRVFCVLLINTALAFPASIFSSLITSHEKFLFSGTLTLLSNIFVHVTNLIFLFLGYKSFTIAMVSLCVNCIVWIVNIVYCKKSLHIKIGFGKLEKSFYRDLFNYSFFILLNIVIDKLYSSTDSIILGKICGSVEVGVYGLGVLFQSYFQQMSTAISSVYFPFISKLSVQKDGMKSMSDIFLKVGHVQMVLLTYIFAGFTTFGKEFVFLWAGKGYENAYFIALIIMGPSVIPLSQNIGISILRAINKHSTRSIMYLVIALLNIGISIPLARIYGGIGAAAGTAVGTILGQILFMNWYYQRLGLDIRKYWGSFLLLLLKVLPIFMVFYASSLISFSGWGGLAIKIGLSQVFALPYSYLVVLNSEERESLKKIMNRFRRQVI